MRAFILLGVAGALAFSGCTRVERETVVEKPVVQPSKEVVVERQVPASPRGCTYGSTAYSHGSVSCQSNSQFRCEDGIWHSLNGYC
jgi:hypothetical protein